MKNEKELLGLFVGTDPMRPNMHHPFRQDGMICATDSKVLIRISEKLCEGAYQDFPDGNKPPQTKRVTPSADLWIPVTIEMLQDAWDKSPAEEKDRTCKDCDGEGMVTWMYLDSKGGSHGMEADCPVCHGTGRISPYTPIKSVFTIRDVAMSYAGVLLLLRVMDLLQVDKILLKHIPNKHGVSFLFGVEGMDIDIVVAKIVYGWEWDWERIKIF